MTDYSFYWQDLQFQLFRDDASLVSDDIREDMKFHQYIVCTDIKTQVGWVIDPSAQQCFEEFPVVYNGPPIEGLHHMSGVQSIRPVLSVMGYNSESLEQSEERLAQDLKAYRLLIERNEMNQKRG